MGGTVSATFFFFFFFFTLVTGPRRSLSLKLSDTRVYEPQIRALDFGTTCAGGDGGNNKKEEGWVKRDGRVRL